MPQVSVNAGNIGTFFFKATFDIYNRQVIFDTTLSSYQGGGFAATLGICFYVQDQDGVTLSSIDFTNPAIPNTSTNPIYTLDLSNVNYAFLFQNYQIYGAIKDASGTIYQTLPIYKTVCQPTDCSDSGFVPGVFKITPNCPSNIITVQEYSLLLYSGLKPISVSKSGILYYPAGTLSPVSFTGTPFNNNSVYSGEYRIVNTTTATYNLQDDLYVLVTYIANSPFNISCATKIADLLCCIEGVQQTYLANCDNAKGQHAKQLLDQITIALQLGQAKEINGQDSSQEAEFIKKTLNCDCGIKSLTQNEVSPANQSSVVIIGVNGTTATPTQNGNTVSYQISSNIYQVTKGNTGDLSFKITPDNTTPGITKYLITFNADQQAINILNAIGASPSLQTQLNSLISVTGGVSLVGLNGSCIIDLTKSDYTVIQQVANTTLVTGIVINATTYAAPTGLSATNPTAIAAWLNSLTLGTFSVSLNNSILLVQTLSNGNTVSAISFSSPSLTVQFSSSNITLVQFLQAVVNYICNLTALQLTIGTNLSLCQFDYNGNVISVSYGPASTQNTYNLGVSSAICNLASRINTLTGITCTTIKNLFPDNANSSFGTSDRLYGTLGGVCAGLTDLQIANIVFSAVGKYASVKTAFCAIDCTSPATCPDISNINISATSQTAIGLYSVSWGTTPTANQTITLRYRVTGTTTWIVSSNSINIFPNGNINGTSPYPQTGLNPGTTYDVWITNNCGGNGFIGQVTTPANTVYSGTFLLDNVLYNICGDSPVTLYSSAPFASGVTMYSNAGLTTIVTGYTYIAPSGSGQIYQINTSTGVVGVNTGSSCTTGTSGTFRLANDTTSICTNSTVTLYTSGGFTVGSVLYRDSALTTIVTGYSYVEYVATALVYALNSSTGVVGASTGVICGNIIVSNDAFSDIVLNDIKVNGSDASGSFPMNPGVSNRLYYTSNIGTSTLVLYVTVETSAGQSIKVYSSNGVLVGCQPAVYGVTTYTFSGVYINNSNPASVQISSSGC